VRTLVRSVHPVPDFGRSTSSPLPTRSMDPADVDDLAALYFASYDAGVACDTLAEAVEDIQISFDGKYGPLLTAASPVAVGPGGALVGAVMVVSQAPWPDVPAGPFIIEAFVDRASRRQGVARALITESIAWLGNAGYSSVALRVADDNTAAADLYEQLGFTDWDGADGGRP
jgi:ribosomal protein S18 acetylase RimI-like enzyme